MKKTLYILRLVLVVLLPLLMALASAKAQTVVYQGKTIPLGVVPVPGNTYEWELYTDLAVNFAVTPGNAPATSAVFAGGNTGPNVDVQWLATGIYFFKVTARDAANCAMNFKIGMIKVIPLEAEAVIAGVTQAGACFNVKLDGSGSLGNLVKYEWFNVGTGGELTRQSGVTTEFLLSPSYTGPLPADFKVRLLVTNDKGYANADTITIKVDRPPLANIYSSGKLEKDGSMIVDGSISTGNALTYKWSTSEGKIIGASDQPTAALFGAGIYTLEIFDTHGCVDKKSFTFPLDVHQVIARPDYARISWAKDTTINVLANDESTAKLVPGSVRVVDPAKRGETVVNADGSITYSTKDRRPGRDEFIYEVCDDLSLCATATVTIDIYDSGILSTEGFSPNGDGINDLLVFRGLDKYPKSSLYIYTRSGQLIYETDDYMNNWDGRTINSTATNQKLVPSGTYYYVIKLGGTNRSLKGFIYVGN